MTNPNLIPREFNELRFVGRWSTVRRIKDQSVASHTFYVTLYAMFLADYLGYNGDKGNLAKYALAHDAEEGFTGDPPGPAKRKLWDGAKASKLKDGLLHKQLGIGRWAKDADMAGRALVKLADNIDAMMYLGTEINLGNQSLGKMEDGLFLCKDEIPKNKTVCSRNGVRLRGSCDVLETYESAFDIRTNLPSLYSLICHSIGANAMNGSDILEDDE